MYDAGKKEMGGSQLIVMKERVSVRRDRGKAGGSERSTATRRFYVGRRARCKRDEQQGGGYIVVRDM